MNMTRRALLGGVSSLLLEQSLFAQYHRHHRPSNPPPPPSPPPTGVPARVIFGGSFVTPSQWTDGAGGQQYTTQSPFGVGANSNATAGEEEEYWSTNNSKIGPNPFAITAQGLSITATPVAALPGGLKYVSGCLSTKGLHYFTPPYYIEMVAKMPTGPKGSSGAWLTFETFTDDFSRELDICQFSGRFPTQEYPDVFVNNVQKAGGFFGAAGADLTAGFHSYGAYVATNGTTIYIDRKPVVSSSIVLASPMYTTVNLAVGDGGGAFVGVDDGSSYTAVIQSITVWNQKPFAG